MPLYQNPLHTTENQRFSSVFGEYKMEILARNELTTEAVYIELKAFH